MPVFVCHKPIEDWSVLMRGRPNLLISGFRDATDALVLAVTPSWRLPVRRLACEARLHLPPVGGTLILDAVDALDHEQQESLLRWLDDAQPAQTQVISLTTTRLYAHVQAGTFLSTLYYRLNTLYFEVSVAR